MPYGALMPARIDTGAASSSLDVSHYRIEGKFVTFTLPDRCGGHIMRSRLVGMKTIRTADGKSRRPIVSIELCVGSEIIKTKVTLNNRERMTYPFLMGRRTLNNRFVVDVSAPHILPPVCRGADAGRSSGIKKP
jgi:hypothetical protein